MIRLMLLTLTVALVGCYDPELGNSPFRCAPTGKECPDGYSCDKKTKVCIPEDKKLDAGRPEAKVPTDADNKPSKEGFVYLDGHPPQTGPTCDDDQEEPNNTADTATKIPGPGLIPGWEICYPGDVDHFSVELEQGDKLVVQVKFFHKNGDLEAALLDPDGFVIAMSRSEDDNEELNISAVTKKGKYVVGVYGFGDATNKYELDLTF
jgi:hypothetical protein